MKINFGRKMKSGIKHLLVDTGLLRGIGSLRPAEVVILRYHSILENPSELDSIIGPGIVHSADDFDKHMRMLRRNFVPVTMDDVLEFATDRKKIPKRSVAVTFDDGFADNAEIAAPIMEQWGVRGAFYVTTGCISPHPPPWFISLRRVFLLSKRDSWTSPLDGSVFDISDAMERKKAFWHAGKHCAVLSIGEQLQWTSQLEEQHDVGRYHNEKLMMTVDQIRRAHTSGHVIGSHTVSHPNVAQVEDTHLATELAASKICLEDILCTPVVHFSYPSPILQPHYDERTILISRSIGYRSAVTCTHGCVRAGDDPLALKRISVPSSVEELRWNIEASFLGLTT